MRTLRRLIVFIGWGAFWYFSVTTKRVDIDWHGMFTIAVLVLFVQSFFRIFED